MTSGDAIERRRVIVRGRVQGVGFRYYARSIATSMNLRGSVRNLPGGKAVEAVVQGEPSLVTQFVNAMQRGPAGAFVESVETTPEKVDPSLSHFHIIT